MFSSYKKIHFTGIGGIGMYSLAALSLKDGISVSGSDISENEYTKDLARRGAAVYPYHSAENLKDAELLVYSLAIAPDNPELAEAERLGIPTLTRAEFMAKLASPYKNRIAVSGSHGKSTVTAMLAHIFCRLGRNPTVIAGAPIADGMPLLLGGSDYLIYEACEYRDSFLKFSPTSVTLINLELDHTDYFKDLEDIKRSFLFSLNSAESFAVINTDDDNLTSILPYSDTDVITVSTSPSSDFTYSLASFGRRFAYGLSHMGKYIGTYTLRIPGVFNITNAVAAIATAQGYGIAPEDAARALESFCGISRRMELIGYRGSRPVYYDYAHHPTEIRAVINSLKEHNEHITVLFCPHTYTRTRDMWDAFVRALSEADFLLVTDIFPAREESIEGITAERLAADAGGIYAAPENAVRLIDSATRGAIILMGAGDLEAIKNEIFR